MKIEVGDLVKRLRDRAESYRIGGPSSEHTAAILDEAATALEVQAAELAEVKKERDALLLGLSAIIHCQSHLSRAEMREAAADILDDTGLTPKWLDGDQSPFVLRAVAAEARLAEKNKALGDIAFLDDNSLHYGPEFARSALTGGNNGQ